MRCPKCDYISFDAEVRCRNCGYDLSLAPRPTEPELTVAREDPDESAPSTDLDLTLDASSGEVEAPPSRTRSQPRADDRFDLPLFGDEEAGRASPPVLPPSARAERPPRRPAQTREPAGQGPGPTLLDAPPDSAGADREAPIVRERWRPDGSDEDVGEPLDRAGLAGAGVAGGGLLGSTADLQPDEDRSGAAPLGVRATAGLIDAFVLLVINLTVLYLTGRVTGLAWGELAQLPLPPLIGFLFLLDASYLVTFTAASGQTIGKSTMGLRVIGMESTRVPLGHAIVRAVVCLLSVVPLGLGLLPILFSADRRGWHDRIAGTRVAVMP